MDILGGLTNFTIDHGDCSSIILVDLQLRETVVILASLSHVVSPSRVRMINKREVNNSSKTDREEVTYLLSLHNKDFIDFSLAVIVTSSEGRSILTQCQFILQFFLKKNSIVTSSLLSDIVNTELFGSIL
mgnify:CR=1 FL=1